jgi:plasmid maintenance system antidote protein VapI
MAENEISSKLESDIQEFANDPAFMAEGLSIKIVEEMLECLERKGLNQSWLAQQMGVSRAHISKILNAQPNMTLLTTAKIAIALGVQPDVSLNSKFGKKQNVKHLTHQEEICYVPVNKHTPAFLEARDSKATGKRPDAP